MQGKGQNLVETLIILSVIIVGTIVALTLLGNNIGNTYNLAADKVTKFKPFGMDTSFITTAGSLGGTPDNPVQQCSAGTCGIDFGDFVLNGIPENFGDFVQTSGTSGGADQLADIFAQLAEQMQTSDPEGYEEYMRLANLVHIQADIVKQVENKAKTNPTNDELYDFYWNKKMSENSYSLPSGLADNLPGLNTNLTFGWQIAGSDINKARNSLIDTPLSQDLINKYSAYAIIDQYDKIMANSKYSESLKTLTQELYLNVADLSFNAAEVLSTTTFCTGGGWCAKTTPVFDPITGEQTGTIDIPQPDPDHNNIILHPQYSLKDNLNGALICTAGKNLDTGKSCHQ